MRKYRKRKLDNIFRQLEIFVCSSKRSKVQESRLADEYRYLKELQNIDQLKNTEEKSSGEANFLIITLVSNNP